jgi:3-oxoacyl-[acyl-carrier-protein] synthase-1
MRQRTPVGRLCTPVGRRAVYLAGFGHHSASGATLDMACNTIAGGNVRCGTRRVAGTSWPYYALGLANGDWHARARQAVCAVGRDVRAGLAIDDAEWAQAGFFFASSSFQIGALEQAEREKRADHSRQVGTAPSTVGCGAAFPAATNGSAELTLPTVADFATDAASWLGIDTTPWCFATACTSSLSALDAAATLIRAGVLRRALVLGVELANDTSLAGFSAMGLLSPAGCRPLDRARDGLVLGEAASAVWLSDEPCGGRWGDWRLAGFEAALDSHSPTGPNPDGTVIADAMSKALECAGLPAAAIELVKLQAAGSPAVDLVEAVALRRVFGERLPPLVSLKPYLGHTLGASGTAELSALIGCLARETVPATPGFSTIDPGIGFAPTTTVRTMQVRHLLFNLIGFGGSVVSLVLERAP